MLSLLCIFFVGPVAASGAQANFDSSESPGHSASAPIVLNGGSSSQSHVTHSPFANVFMNEQSGSSSSAGQIPRAAGPNPIPRNITAPTVRQPQSPGYVYQRPPVTHSPFNNVHNSVPTPVYEHQATIAEVNPLPGQWYAAWPGGFIVGGSPGHPCHAGCRWIGGFWTTRTYQQWVPEQYVEDFVPPAYEYRVINGQVAPIEVRSGYWTRTLIPAHFETRFERVWVPGGWLCIHRGGHGHHKSSDHVEQAGP